MTISYSISDRSNTITSIGDARNQLDYYEGKVKSELSKARLKSGLNTEFNILLRFLE